MSIVNLVMQIMTIANMIQTAIEVATCGIGALITRVILPVIATIILSIAIPEIVEAWTGLTLPIMITISDIINVALGGLASLIMWIVEKILAIITIIIGIKQLMNYDNTLHNFITKAVENKVNPITILIISMIYAILNEFLNITEKILGSEAKETIIRILSENADNPDEVSEEIKKLKQTEVKKDKNPIEEARTFYRTYLLSISTIIMAMEAIGAILGAKEAHKKYEEYSTKHKYKEELRGKWYEFSLLFLAVGIIIELSIEYHIISTYQVTPNLFIDFASDDYGAFKIAIIASLLFAIISELFSPLTAAYLCFRSRGNNVMEVATKVFISKYGIISFATAVFDVIMLIWEEMVNDKARQLNGGDSSGGLLSILQILQSVFLVTTSLGSAIQTICKDLKIFLRCQRKTRQIDALRRVHGKRKYWTLKHVVGNLKKDEIFKRYRREKIINMLVCILTLVSIVAMMKSAEMESKLIILVALIVESIVKVFMLKEIGLEDVGIAIAAGILTAQIIAKAVD